MVLKAERERVKALLTEAITVLCKNGLGYKYTCAIEGLLGITLDDEDVFLVNINETIQKAERPAPVEELAKQETGTASPASSSPSGTPRRRRRHSQEGEAQHSPAKRANYGTGEQEQQPAAKEDVIVIKEEVSETEFTDFYGDTGGGNNDDGGQYAMQQGDQQYPGAGCSQWDTSQTQGGQSDWPAFNPTQQQQAAISQAASSAMMSPSQMSPTTQHFGHPSSRISPSIKELFTQHLIKPVLSHNLRVIAFRMSWPRQNLEGTMNTWKDIVQRRTGIDQVLGNLPITSFFVSAVCASTHKISDQKTKSDYKIVPSVSYWMVTTDHQFDMRQLFTSMQSNQYGAALKLQLQPYQQSEDHISNALFLCVKDNVEGCVRQLVDLSARHLCPGGGGPQEPIVKVVVKDPQFSEMIQHLVNRLDAVQFNVQLIDGYSQ